MQSALPTFLPGELTLSRGTASDYFQLEQFHYLPKRPATWADVWSIRYHDRAPVTDPRCLPVFSGGRHGRVFPSQSRVVAVGVLSYPVPSSGPRERFLNRAHLTRKQNLIFANAGIRTISRVVVHPQFRSLGLSTILVRCLCEHCPTRYVEAAAIMARAHPFFERAGMTRIDPDREDRPVYFIFDRFGSGAPFSQSTDAIAT